MDADRLQDRFYWGLNRIAIKTGRLTDAFRADGVSNPLDRSNRFLQLRAAFSRADGRFTQPVGFDDALWRGYFDASYTRVGDYLVHQREVWFIASQSSLMPILCVRTNRIISITRQITPATGSATNLASGTTSNTVIAHWPASVLGIGTGGRPLTELPGATGIPTATVLLPGTHGQILQPADVVRDELGRAAIIVAAELSDLGWRLNIRAVTT